MILEPKKWKMVSNIPRHFNQLDESLLPQNVVLNVWLEFPKNYINLTSAFHRK